MRGPLERRQLESDFLEKFAGFRLIGPDLPMERSLDARNPFDLLMERDSSRDVSPDIVLLSHRAKVQVVVAYLVESNDDAGVERGERRQSIGSSPQRKRRSSPSILFGRERNARSRCSR